MARRPQACHALSVPQRECASSARRKTSSRSAYEGRRLLRAPVNGARRRVRGPAAGPKRGMLADFHKTQKKLVAGIISGATAPKIATACRRDAFVSPRAVIAALKYIKYLGCHGLRRSAPKLCFRVCLRPLSDRRWWLFHCLSRALLKSPFLYEKCDFPAPAEMPPTNRRPSRNRDAGAC